MPSKGNECKCLHSFPPWEVPRKRKLRGMLKGRDCYDPIEENLFTSKGGEITTHNRFSPIADYYNLKEVLHDDEKKPDLHPVQDKKISRKVYFKNHEDFIMRSDSDSFCCENCLNNNYDSFMYTNKINFCSGYFPEFILLPHVDRQLDSKDTFIDCKNSKYKNDDNNLYLNYFPKFCDGKYTKQLSNANSKYNNYYFHKMKPIYKICKKLWKPQEKSPGYGIVADGSGIGTMGDINYIHQYKYSYKYSHQYKYSNNRYYGNNNSSNNKNKIK